MQNRQIALVASLVFLAYVYFLAYFVFVRRATSKLAHESYAKYKCVSAVSPSCMPCHPLLRCMNLHISPDDLLKVYAARIQAVLHEELRKTGSLDCDSPVLFGLRSICHIVQSAITLHGTEYFGLQLVWC